MMTKNTDIYFTTMTITPEKAMHWLETANLRNRPISQNHINKLASDMKSGEWELSHEAIAFDPHGILIDGQHRLWAIVEADRPMHLPVAFNVPSEAMRAITGGRPRTVVDVLKIGNKDGNVSTHHTSTLRSMLGGMSCPRSLTVRETSEQLAIHREAVDFAVRHLSSCRTQGICNSTTRAVIARAWYSADPELLIRFCELLTSGIISHIPSATVLVSLRQYLMTHKSSSTAERREKYGRTARALKAFLKGESLSKLVPATKELFPLPEEKKAACA